ncbi:MAG: hypothetical protein P8188_12835 [Gemmatimonadota bacterium]
MRDRFAWMSLMGALALLAATPGTGWGQDWETLSASRRQGDVSRFDVRVRYGAGSFQVRPAESGVLYDVELRYDAEQFDPVAEYRNGRLEVGTDTHGRNTNVKDSGGEMVLQLARDVETDLVLEFGAVRANLDLGGMALSSLDLETGASESTVDFSAPNQIRMRSAEMQVGAAAFTANNLGNLNADRLEFSAGVGEVVLDFGGEWVRDLEVDLSMGLGSLELHIPQEIGVRMDKDSFLTSLDAPAMVKDGDSYYSENWDDAEHRLRIDIDAAFGSIRVVRTR